VGIASRKTGENLHEDCILSLFATYRSQNTRSAGAIIQTQQVPGAGGWIRVGNFDPEGERFASLGLKDWAGAAAPVGTQ